MNTPLSPPPVIDFARLIAWAIVDESVRWTGRQTLFVGDKLLGAVPRLAICQNISGPLTDVLLFHCNEEWEVQGVSGAKSHEAVREIAERAYEGISAKWQEVKVSPADAEAWIRENRPNYVCAFCGKLPTEMSNFFHSEKAAICAGCVQEMHRQMHAQPGTSDA
jgi:hypothetical protein